MKCELSKHNKNWFLKTDIWTHHQDLFAVQMTAFFFSFFLLWHSCWWLQLDKHQAFLPSSEMNKRLRHNSSIQPQTLTSRNCPATNSPYTACRRSFILRKQCHGFVYIEKLSLNFSKFVVCNPPVILSILNHPYSLYGLS